MNKNNALMVSALLLSGLMLGCQPRTTAEKAEDKMGDAAHETGQAIDRTVDRVKDSTRPGQ
jgi:hypothetical protein